MPTPHPGNNKYPVTINQPSGQLSRDGNSISKDTQLAILDNPFQQPATETKAKPYSGVGNWTQDKHSLPGVLLDKLKHNIIKIGEMQTTSS